MCRNQAPARAPERDPQNVHHGNVECRNVKMSKMQQCSNSNVVWWCSGAHLGGSEREVNEARRLLTLSFLRCSSKLFFGAIRPLGGDFPSPLTPSSQRPASASTIQRRSGTAMHRGRRSVGLHQATLSSSALNQGGFGRTWDRLLDQPSPATLTSCLRREFLSDGPGQLCAAAVDPSVSIRPLFQRSWSRA